jgi:hypothetical protein
MADLLNTTLIGVKRTGVVRLRRAIRKCYLGIWAVLRRWLLHLLSDSVADCVVQSTSIVVTYSHG